MKLVVSAGEAIFSWEACVVVGATAVAAWNCWMVACSRLFAMFCVGDILREEARTRVVSVRRAVSAGMLRRAFRGRDMVAVDRNVKEKRGESEDGSETAVIIEDAVGSCAAQ